MTRKVIVSGEETPKTSGNLTSLNIGCGSLAIKGWENIDCDASLINWFKLHDPDLLPFFKLKNALKEFDYKDESLDRIYLSNFVEHLEPIECRSLLSNCLRALKPDGHIRIVVPDMYTILRHYNNDQMNTYDSSQPEMFKKSSRSAKLAYMLFGNLYNADPNFPQGDNYIGHKMAYCYESLHDLLAEVGFNSILEIEPVSNDQCIFSDITEFEQQHLPMWYMLVMEAKK